MRKLLQPTGSKILSIDMNDPLLGLYFPLWYPYNDMDGAIIRSYDKTRSTGTVNGALWTPTGRYFDGNNDQLDTNYDNHTVPITIIVWAQTDEAVATNDRYALDTSNGAAGYMLRMNNGAGVMALNSFYTVVGLQGLSVAIPDTKYHMYSAKLLATGIQLSIDCGAWQTAGFAADTLVDPSDNLSIGSNVAALGTNVWKGVIGEVTIFSRNVDDGIICDIRDATKWRYL